MTAHKQKAPARFGPSRYVRWRNDTGQTVELMVDGKPVSNWYSTRIYSLPVSASKAARKAGLTRLGYSQ